MKSAISAAAFALALTVGPAFAADHRSGRSLPALPDLPDLPAADPAPMWTGFHVGFNAGGTWAANGRVETSAASFPGTSGIFEMMASNVAPVATGAGFIGGGQIGYNWQFGEHFVLGGEADMQGVAGANGAGAGVTTAAPVPGFNYVSSVAAARSLNYLGSVRGRIGCLFTPTVMIFGSGGLAYGGVNLGVSALRTLAGAPFLSAGSAGFADTLVGWTAGGGLEWLFWENWSARFEYLYYDLGSVRQSGLLTGYLSGFASPFAAMQSSTRFNGNLVRLGLSYHFNWDSDPMIASY